MAKTETKTFYPGAHDKNDYSYASISGETNVVGKGSDNASRVIIKVKTGSNAVTYTRWPFDCSIIPADATIDTVSCKVAVATSSASGVTYTLQLYSGTSAKGSATTFSGTTRTVYTLSCGKWTRDELQKSNLYIQGRRGTSGASLDRDIYYYGADLTVTYTYQSEQFMLKLGGSWEGASRVFKKVSGIWVEQSDLANVVEDGVRYKNGGEIESPNKTVSIFGAGHQTYAYATINGTKYTSDTRVSVPVGTLVTVTVSDSIDGSYGEVYVDDITNVVGTQYSFYVTENTAVSLNAVEPGSGYYIGRVFVMSGVSEQVAYFTINLSGLEMSFPFEPGMTWSEYCDSKYGSCWGFIIFNGMVGVLGGNGSNTSYLSEASPTSLIVPGKVYIAA